jgi:hypothetical protein
VKIIIRIALLLAYLALYTGIIWFFAIFNEPTPA